MPLPHYTHPITTATSIPGISRAPGTKHGCRLLKLNLRSGKVSLLLDDPGGTIGSTLEFLGLDTDPQVVRFANEILVRRTTPRDGVTPSARHKAVGGDLLAASLDCRTGLSQLPAARRLAAAATGQPAS